MVSLYRQVSGKHFNLAAEAGFLLFSSEIAVLEIKALSAYHFFVSIVSFCFCCARKVTK